MKIGDWVRYYIDARSYLSGIIVEMCEDGTVWVEHDNGQQRRYAVDQLVIERQIKKQEIKKEKGKGKNESR